MDVKLELIQKQSPTKFKIIAFETWFYKRMLKISWTSLTTNSEVLQKHNWCKGNNSDQQRQRYVLCGSHNEKHIKVLHD